LSIFFRKSVEKIQVLLKSEKNNGYFTRRHTFSIKFRSVLLRMKNISDEFVEKLKTHILCSISFFFFFENRAVYEIMWKSS